LKYRAAGVVAAPWTCNPL